MKTDHPLAPFWRRLFAGVYDGFILIALLMAATALVLPFSDGEHIPSGTLWYQVYLLGIIVAFYTFFWTRSGQTLGMLAWKLRLRRDDGEKPEPWDCMVRLLMMVLTLSPVLFGFLWMIFDRDRLTLYDRVSRTRVEKIP